MAEKLKRDISICPPELVALAQVRIQYVKEIERRQPIAITQRTIEPLIRSISEQINDTKPPSWRTVCRDHRKWLAAGGDIRAIISHQANRGNRIPRMPLEVKAISEQVLADLYMTPERKRVPEVHLEILRRLNDIWRRPEIAELQKYKLEIDAIQEYEKSNNLVFLPERGDESSPG